MTEGCVTWFLAWFLGCLGNWANCFHKLKYKFGGVFCILLIFAGRTSSTRVRLWTITAASLSALNKLTLLSGALLPVIQPIAFHFKSECRLLCVMVADGIMSMFVATR